MASVSKLCAVFISVAIVVVLGAAINHYFGQRVIGQSDAVIQQLAIIEELQTSLSTIKDGETGQRGYLLTGDEKYLEPYQSAIQTIHRDLADLHSRAVAGELSEAEVDQFQKLSDEKFAEMARTISLRQTSGPAEALALVKTDLGLNTMDQIRRHVDQMLVERHEQLGNSRISLERLAEIRSILFVIVGLSLLGFLVWSYLRLKREMFARDTAVQELSSQKDLLSVTLSSIGDAVIVTDVDARITFMNPIAENLTGWLLEESRGVSCRQIFHIINEDSRQTVDNPVDKVLKTGLIVGLANHTLLIRKDGTEIPIDDSGAPIRDAGGTIRGAVLVFRDFSEHKATEQALIDAKRDLEAANKAKDQFLATLSHELRTPLTPVLAMLTRWETDSILPPAFLADVQMLRRNVEFEARLIDDLLDLTRIVRGKLSLNPEPCDVHHLISNVGEMYRSEIQGRGMSYSTELSAERHFAFADPARLQQVFWNILKNAAKFTSEGGTIHVATRTLDDNVLAIDFVDSGIGMSRETIDRLFHPFEQGAADIVRRYGGLGLGMAISKALMEAQGGGITAASTGVGEGSTFTVKLPSIDSIPEETSTDASQPAPVREPGAGLHILLVEDHVDTAHIMSRLLTSRGHRIKIAGNVADAIAAAEAESFDMLVSDIGLPDGTGMELVRRLIAFQPMPAIALTGFGMDDDIAKCREAGFVAHLTKPVNFQQLEQTINRLAPAPK